MRRRHASIPVRRAVFVGCEGQSEVSYATMLQKLADAAGQPVHLMRHDLGKGAGDPLARVKAAGKLIARFEERPRDAHARFVLLDADQVLQRPEHEHEAERLARTHGITIIWQRPCFEAFLLRHLPSCRTRTPPNTSVAHHALQREWPGYVKPMVAAALQTRIRLQDVVEVAQADERLHALVRRIGLIR